ncbi:MAG: heparan-alpha-glucosaminide N-acetyltransferase domain-containing protein [Alistipes sp.]|nr:heparan-alpha-glucosaminide N-acetyltransferase domain-containing protein [Alistipes sp.]
MQTLSDTPRRLPSLDILRGLTVALMILVNNPGSWSHKFDFLAHSAWDGCTPTDLVFPFFLFIVGASVWFAFRRYDHRLSGQALRKIVRRGLTIWAVGIVISKFPYYNFLSGEWIAWHNVRIMGVLPRIGLCYMIGSVLVLGLRSTRRIAAAALLLLAAYEAMVYALGDATLEGFFGAKVDTALLGEEHLYHGYRNAAGERMAFDPEGLMSTMSAVVNVLLGFLAAKCIGQSGDHRCGMMRIGVWGGIGVLAALALNTVIPINKPIWSGTYVLYTCGIAAIVWNAVSYLTDRRSGTGKAGRVFEVFGTNALLAYVLSTLFAKIFAQMRVWNAAHDALVSPYARWYEILASCTSPQVGSMLCALSLVVLCWLVTWPLYRKRIYIKL